MNNSLYFKHFRKFKEFQNIDFGDITFLVGKNNSGKSTFVKVILLLYKYLKTDNVAKLTFNQENYEDVNIVTYGRAFNKNLIKEGYLDDGVANYICFDLELANSKGKFKFALQITGELDSTEASVMDFSIDQNSSDFSIQISPQQKRISIEEKSNSALIELKNTSKKLKERIYELKTGLNLLLDNLSKEYILLNADYEKAKKDLEGIEYQELNADIMNINTDFSTFYKAQSLSDIFNEAYENFIESHKVYESVDLSKKDFEEENVDNEEEWLHESDPSDYDQSLDLTNINIFNANKDSIKDSFKDVIMFIEQLEIIYLPATLNKHSSLFAIKDSKNSLAQTIHEYFQMGLQENPIIQSFLKRWLNEFEIANTIEIKIIEGEAYTANLIKNGLIVSLADAGMGAIQATLLLLRMAIVIYKQSKLRKDVIVVLEEPELNLHPALQSKLCDLFFQIYSEYKVKFIIETHSEYIIRKTQLLVKNKDLEIAPNENPFSVLYFNDDLKVWNMNYREDGRFSNEFGSGFFDESSNLAFELM